MGNSTVKEFDYDSVRAPSTPIRKAVVLFWTFVKLCTVVLSISCCKCHLTWELFTLSFLGGKAKTHVSGFERNHPISRNLPLQTLPLWDWCRSLLLNATRFATACGDAQGYLQRHFWIPWPTRWLGHATPLAIHKVRMFDSIHTLQLPPSSCRDVKLKEFLPTVNFFIPFSLRMDEMWPYHRAHGCWLQTVETVLE